MFTEHLLETDTFPNWISYRKHFPITSINICLFEKLESSEFKPGSTTYLRNFSKVYS